MELKSKIIIGFVVSIAFQVEPALADDHSANTHIIQFGSWTLSLKPDAITDVVRPIASVKGDGGEFGFACAKSGIGSVFAMALSDSYLGAGEPARDVEWRVDSRPGIRDGQWTYYRRYVIRDDPSEIVNALDGSQIKIRMIDYNFSSHMAIFSLDGAREALTRLYAECRDTLPFAPTPAPE